MNTPYIGQERRKSHQLELLTKRVLTLELQAHRQEELLELATAHLKESQRKLVKEFDEMKTMCQGCPCFGDDYK